MLSRSPSLLRFSSRSFDCSYSKKAMTDHRTPDARRRCRGWGGFHTSGPGPVSEGTSGIDNKYTTVQFNLASSSGKSSTSSEDCSSSFRKRHTSTETKGSSNVIDIISDNEVSSGNSNMLAGNRLSGFIADSMRKSPQTSMLQIGQTSSQTVKGRSNLRGSGSDSQSNVHKEDRTSRSSAVTNRNKSPQRPRLSQSSPEMIECKSNVHKEDRTSRSSAVTYRNKSPQRPRLRQSSPEIEKGSTNVGGPESKFKEHLFDICKSASIDTVQLKISILEKNRERKREQFKPFQQPKYLRSGMVLLKNYISLEDQETIIKSCRELGIGEGGFYKPGYRDGAKLHLKMMCLGKDWDPESRMYGDYRSIDGARPPEIPVVFRSLVEGAIKAAHDLIRGKNRYTVVEDELPKMSPEICIVNFYSNTGKLGLHQDRDESSESIAKGLPIVSFSVGDSAEFLYGDKRDVDTAEKLVLESGDVLIFGGKSRSLFHGVSSILPNTTPKSLVEETKLRPGRLNLTFRQL